MAFLYSEWPKQINYSLDNLLFQSCAICTTPVGLCHSQDKSSIARALKLSYKNFLWAEIWQNVAQWKKEAKGISLKIEASKRTWEPLGGQQFVKLFSLALWYKQKRGLGPHWRDMTARLQLLREAPPLPRFGKTGQWPKCHCEWKRSQIGKDEAGWNMWQAVLPQVITLSKSHPRRWVTLLNLNSACLNLTYIPLLLLFPTCCLHI